MNPPAAAIRQACVEAGARLHFGLIRVGPARRRFGGLGLMIETPGVRLRAQEAEAWSFEGPFRERLAEFAPQFARRAAFGSLGNSAYAIQVDASPPSHSGLGSGTQVLLSAAAAIYAAAGLPLCSPRQLALETGRGARSAIGCHGFYQGGLLFEGGKSEEEPLSELQCRVDFSDAWRIVLIRPLDFQGVAGTREEEYFTQAPIDSDSHAEEMTTLAREVLIPSAFEADFAAFSAALFRYGWLAGEAFAFAQGDVFSHPQARQRVEDLRRRGVTGVGQSSWGPTLFALLPNESDAQRLVDECRAEALYAGCEWTITAARNRGADIRSGVALTQ